MVRTSNARARLGLVLLLWTGVCNAAQLSPGFDTSGDGLLTGNYFVRQVSCSDIGANGTNGRARSLSGTFAFDGKGNYSFAGQMMDTSSGSSQPASYTATGVYAVSSNNLIEISNPLDAQQLMSGALGVSALVASSPTGGSSDLLIALPASATPVSATTLQGSYWMSLLDFLQGNSLLARDALFVMSATGSGSFGTFVLSGNAVNLGITPLTQVVTGATYTLHADGSGTAVFPVPSGTPVQSRLIGGNKILYVSSDGNLLVGGAADGYDLLVGMRPLPAAATNDNLKGLFFQAGMQVNFSPLRTGGAVAWSSNSGSFNASGTGVSIWHQHLLTPGSGALDYTFDSEYSLSSNGSVSEAYAQYAVGAGGQAFLLTGNADNYQLALAVKAPALTQTGVFLNPMYVANSANFAPITNPIAPGELVSLYGSGLAAAATVASGTSYPPQLGGVSVSMNGLPAPLYQVAPGRIDALVPFAAADATPYIKIQVNNNGQLSNTVMVYASAAAPGVFTLGQSGIGEGAVLHLNYTIVTPSQPAHPGEIVQVFATGLGKVTPAVADGAPGPANPPANTIAPVTVFIDGQAATPYFAGLAPLYPGLYQINVQVPPTAGPGSVYLDISTAGAYHSQARIYVSP